MADYPTSLRLLFEDERFPGYVWAASDAGGETVTGISRVYHPKARIWAELVDPIKARLGLVRIHLATPAQAAAINAELLKEKDRLLELVGDFYRPEFWDPLGLSTEPIQVIADKAFNVAVWRGVAEGRALYADMKAA